MANFLDLFSPKGRFREGIKALHDFIASKGEPLGLASLNSLGKVPATQLPDMSVADGSVTEAKIAVGAVTTTKIPANNIVASHIADGAVTGSKLAATLTRAMTLLGGPAIRFDTTMASGGTGTTQVPAYYIAASGATEPTTWSTAGTYLGMNAVAGYAGNFIDCHLNGGVTLFAVDSAGRIRVGTSSKNNTAIRDIGASANTGVYFSAVGTAPGIGISISGTTFFQTGDSNNGVVAHGGWGYCWGTSAADGAVDTGLRRAAAGVVEVCNGTLGTRRDLQARRLNLNGLPTSASGLVAGDLWNDAGTLKIV